MVSTPLTLGLLHSLGWGVVEPWQPHVRLKCPFFSCIHSVTPFTAPISVGICSLRQRTTLRRASRSFCCHKLLPSKARVELARPCLGWWLVCSHSLTLATQSWRPCYSSLAPQTPLLAFVALISLSVGRQCLRTVSESLPRK